ncbi:hypothetical protein ES703_92282 [subsurface metagenome]
MVGVPAAADIGFLVRFLAHFRYLRIAGRRLEEPVDVDGPEALREGDVLFGSDGLVPEEDHAVFVEGGTQLFDIGIVEPAR